MKQFSSISLEEFENFSVEAQYFIYQKYLWYSFKAQGTICLGFLSLIWLFHYYYIISPNPEFASIALVALIINGFLSMIFPAVWDYYKPRWSEHFIENLKNETEHNKESARLLRERFAGNKFLK